MSGSLPDDSTNVKWMYEGKDSSIDREAYLLGKRITKVEEDKGDFVVEKKTNENLSVSVLERLDYESKVREDPLFAIRNKESEKRRELLSNPVKRRHLQTSLKNALLKDLGSSGKHKKKRRSSLEGHHRKHKNRKRHSSSSSSTSDSSQSSIEDVHISKSKKILKNAHKDKNLHAALKKALEKDLNKSKHVSSSESDRETRHKKKKAKKYKKVVEDNHERRHQSYHEHSSSPKKSKKRSKHGRSHEDADNSPRDSQTSEHGSKKNSRQEKDGYGLIVMAPHHSKSAPKGRKSPTPPPVKEKYVRKERSGFTKKLSKEDLEKRRREMMESANWRDEQRQKNVTHYNKKEELEVKREKHIRNLHDDQLKKHGKVKTFLHSMKLDQVSHGSLEDTVRRKRHRMERTSND